MFFYYKYVKKIIGNKFIKQISYLKNNGKIVTKTSNCLITLFKLKWPGVNGL